MSKKCIWCLKEELEVTFLTKAHTIPKSLGGQNYNLNVCDSCNEYFGKRLYKFYSIEGALKETFNVTRFKLLQALKPKRKIGEFKSVFFNLKIKKNHLNLIVKDTFRFDYNSQNQLCRAFKRGLYKLYFEELNRQKNIGYESTFDIIREFSRYDLDDLPVYYFNRSVGVLFMTGTEVETPILFFDRMNYLYSNEYFAEIEFLGHVFGFPINKYTPTDFDNYLHSSIQLKQQFFKGFKEIKRLTDIDLLLSIMNEK